MSNVVEAWGVGKEDNRSGPIYFSEKYAQTVSVDVPAGVTVDAPLYEIPTGKKLIIGYLKGSCDASFIQLMELYESATVRYSIWVDVNVIVSLSDISGIVFEEGTTMSFRIENTDSETHNYRAVICGYLEDM